MKAFENSNTYYSVNITAGLTYRVRYRAKNVNGWSEWSPVGYIQTATVPSAPNAPSMISSTGTTLTMRINPSILNGGSLITSYKLFKDDGSFGSPLTLVAQFDADKIAPATFVLSATVPSDDIVSGQRYRFFSVATNDIGDSLPSYEAFYTVTPLP